MPTARAGIAYQVEGDGEALVWLHGVTLDGRMWSAQVAAFRDRFRCLTVDRRGHGSSAPMADGRSVTGDLLGVLDEAGVDRCHLVGLSLGGYDAVNFAGQHPERLRSLTLVDAWLPVPAMSGWRPQWLADRVKGQAEVRAAWLVDPVFAEANRDPALRARLHAMVSGNDLAIWLGGIKLAPEPNATELAATIQTPTLVVVGELDLPPFQTVARWLQATIPGATAEPLLVLPGAGHMAPMEQPASFNAALAAFLARTEPGAAPPG